MQREGAPAVNPKVFLLGYLHMFVSAWLMGCLLTLVSGSLSSFARRAGFVAFAGIVGTLFANLSTPIWFFQPPGFHLANTIYMAVAWVLAGLVLAAMLKPPTSDPVPEASA